MRLLPAATLVAAALLVVSCSHPAPPPGVTVVSPFEIHRYLGTWYEIARMDHRFERGLERVTTTYTLREDGGINVRNRGYNPDRGLWQKIEGVAWFSGRPDRAAMRISFFGPFYGNYSVIAVDKTYQHALVCGPDRNVLWILARTPVISAQVKQQMLNTAASQGFAVQKLLWVKQSD